MNQGILEVVKQQMARVNIDILGISEIKWTEMGEFNSDDHCIDCYGQESHNEAKGKGEKERYTHLNAEFQRIAERDKKDFLSDQCKQKENNRMISVHFQGKAFNTTVIQVYATTTNAEEAEQFYEDYKTF